MMYHYYRDLLSDPRGRSTNLFAVNKIHDKSETEFMEPIPHHDFTSKPRIAIVGGGIAGVTAANALSKKLSSNNISAKIVVFEEDEHGGTNEVDFSNHQQPSWLAATARNANTICPGASMHVMSQRKTLTKIMKDTVREWFEERLKMIQSIMQKEHLAADHLLRLDNFDYAPPYFALHLLRCMGPSASWDERATFLTFLTSFLKTSLFSTEHDVHERGNIMYQLAKSNRVLFLEAINNSNVLASKTGLSQGFISLYRSKQDAVHDFQKGETLGEEFTLLSYEEAVKLEPRIRNLPIGEEVVAVHRKADYTADCAVYIKALTKKITNEYGVEYKCGLKGKIHSISAAKYAIEDSRQLIGMKMMSKALATDPVAKKQRFSLRTKDGRSHDFDFVVLAAGINTPLFARMLSIGDSCPTYPLRGYSLTMYTAEATETASSQNLMNQPIKIDDMYCTSVGANMARIAGFGELVGYRDKAADVPSVAPRVLSRYGRTLFPESNTKEATVLQCFRPLSPDDLPIVGAVSSAPGVFVHSGHGTLGWTLCLATSECLATALTDEIKGIDRTETFRLPGDVSVERARLSPDRFI